MCTCGVRQTTDFDHDVNVFHPVGQGSQGGPSSRRVGKGNEGQFVLRGWVKGRAKENKQESSNANN